VATRLWAEPKALAKQREKEKSPSPTKRIIYALMSNAFSISLPLLILHPLTVSLDHNHQHKDYHHKPSLYVCSLQ